MSQKILIARSAVPDIRRRQDEADYFNPLVGMTNGEYWADEHPAEPMPRQCFEYPTEEVIKDIQETFRMDSEQFLMAETERSRRAKEAYYKQLKEQGV